MRHNRGMDQDLRSRLNALGDGLHRLALADGRRAIAKRRRRAPPGFFAAEAYGLVLLADAGGLRVPAVHALDEDVLVIDDLGRGRATPEAWARAGHALARQHGEHAPAFGLDGDGWCGDSPQANTPMTDGWRFFAQCRLWPQARRAAAAGLLSPAQTAALERICSDLRARVPAQPPSLLHGDLWSGNLHACGDGELALIDAGAVHYGWAEADLAMLLLFGEPPAGFFAAYREASGIDPGWRERAPLYNLYHLLNHLNLFGGGYAQAVGAALRRLA